MHLWSWKINSSVLYWSLQNHVHTLQDETMVLDLLRCVIMRVEGCVCVCVSMQMRFNYPEAIKPHPIFNQLCSPTWSDRIQQVSHYRKRSKSCNKTRHLCSVESAVYKHEYPYKFKRPGWSGLSLVLINMMLLVFFLADLYVHRRSMHSACCRCCFFHCVPGRLASGLSSGPGAAGSRQGRGGVGEPVASSARRPPPGAPLRPG